MTVNWNKLRSWNGSDAKAFEELCCQLAADETVPAESRFFRKGTPDAGVECFWLFPDSHEWAWQAKWFRSSPKAAQWAEIDKSVASALSKHPRLTKYTICLPIDRSDARIKKQESFLKKWKAKVSKWEELARKKEMAVTFEYWGESEIGSRLSGEKHRGRLWFWFHEESFGNAWFTSRMEEAVANARDRYTPELNIELPIRQHFDAMGRTKRFSKSITEMYSGLKSAARDLRPFNTPTDVKRNFEQIENLTNDAIVLLGDWIIPQTHNEWNATRQIPWDAIGTKLELAHEHILDSISAIRNLKFPESQENDNAIPSREERNISLHRLFELKEAISKIEQFLLSDECKLSNTPAMLMVGPAGQGKTHLFCHVGKTDTVQHYPRVLLHGEQFKDEDPWSQLIMILGLNCSRDEFVGALEAAAQASNSKVLILIDAINEGDGKRLWFKHMPGILNVLRASPWLAICFSVRDSYESLIVPDALDDSSLIRVHHDGFEALADDASARFFEHYGIEPSTPLLLTEFSNPLFLKLFCEGIRNSGHSRIPDGLQGISAVFEFYIDSINRKLSKPAALDYDVRSRVVRNASNALAEEMAKERNDHLPLEKARSIVDSFLFRSKYEESLFRNLESEGVLTIFPQFVGQQSGLWVEAVRFTYQRFSDHLIARNLLAKHFDLKNPAAAFSKRRTLGRLLKNEGECYRNRGILEAFVIQVPELAGLELTEIAPYLITSRSMKQAFLASIVWRKSESFKSGAFSYVNSQILNRADTSAEFFDAILSVATAIAHPFNAKSLSKNLRSQTLPKRDAWWSIYLHSRWGSHSAVDRLVNWAANQSDRSHFSDEVVHLAGVTLTWFLTTSNRFLRDRSTKALVRLLEIRLPIVRQLIEEFWNVDDPYLLERLFAVAYGCAMRTTDDVELEKLANTTYSCVFEGGEPVPHILLRDYARGVIEIALHRCPSLNVDLRKLRPPYKSKWPGLRIPSAEVAKKIGEWSDKMPDGKLALAHLHRSIMEREDFSRYVIGDLDEWTSVRIGQALPPTHREIFDQFKASLTTLQEESLLAFERLASNTLIFRRRGRTKRKDFSEDGLSDEQLQHALDNAEDRLRAKLRRNSAKDRVFIETVKDFVLHPYNSTRENAFDGTIARRWILQRVLDLGWTADRFGTFDRNMTHHFREANKPERIGKKYQWIAYHELLARLSDNFMLREEKNERGPTYNVPDDVGVRRDIDPSNLLRRSRADFWAYSHTLTWWAPLLFKSWEAPVKDESWLREHEDLPNVERIISVTDSTNEDWLTLNGHYRWSQPIPAGEDRNSIARRSLSYSLNCYLVRQRDAKKLIAWAGSQNWVDMRMPGVEQTTEVCLGEFCWSPNFLKRDSSYYGREGWTRGYDKRFPVEILATNDQYLWESGNFDCSIEENLSIYLPCKFLVNSMSLSWNGEEGKWFDPQGQLVAFDPSVDEPGPHALLFRRKTITSFLQENDLTLLWTLSGERLILGDRLSSPGRLKIGGMYALEANALFGSMKTEFRAF